jgi:hypothetical protein
MLKNFLLILVGTLSVTTESWGSFSYSNVGSLVSQNFDSLASSGTANAWSNDVTLDGWYLFAQPATPIVTYGAETGSSGNFTFNSYGTTVSDRALGGLGSGGTYWGSPANGNIAGYIAFALQNNTGTALTGFTIGFDGEQWRRADNSSANSMVLEYGIGNTFSTVTSWNAPGGTFNWASPVVGTGTAAAVNGNAAGLVGSRGGSINFSVADGETLWIRWIERNDVGNDHALAIDNFTITAVPEPTSLLFGGILGGAGWIAFRRQRKAKQAKQPEPTTV